MFITNLSFSVWSPFLVNRPYGIERFYIVWSYNSISLEINWFLNKS